jgi:ABC-type hemin transport system ATPase subunit
VIRIKTGLQALREHGEKQAAQQGNNSSGKINYFKWDNGDKKIIRFLKEREIGVLITDHNVRETLGICDRATIINEGEVLAAGSPADIVANERVRQVYLGEHFRM